MIEKLFLRKEVENKLKIADRFIDKFQLKNEEIQYLCESKNSALHPVGIFIKFFNFFFQKCLVQPFIY